MAIPPSSLGSEFVTDISKSESLLTEEDHVLSDDAVEGEFVSDSSSDSRLSSPNEEESESYYDPLSSPDTSASSELELLSPPGKSPSVTI